MMRFSERTGIVSVRNNLQINYIDDALRNSLWNALDMCIWDDYSCICQFDILGSSNFDRLFLITIKKRFPKVQVIDPDYIAKDMTGSFSSVDQEQLATSKVAFLLDEESTMDDNSAAIKQAILAVLQDRG